jgi:hypothetical protein
MRESRNRNPSDESTVAEMSCWRVEQTKNRVIEMKEVQSQFVKSGGSGQLRVIGWMTLAHA